MRPEVAAKLVQLNQHFYQAYGTSFAATRRRVQPGIRRALALLPKHGSWLDLGCGSGALALEWANTGRTGSYLGLDFSPVLLEEAIQAVCELPTRNLTIRYALADLTNPGWTKVCSGVQLDGVVAFAVLHHLPSAALRREILKQTRQLVAPGARFVHSVWQFQHSPRLVQRQQPWESIGISTADVEPGDALLDWRAQAANQPSQAGLRYVHLFDRSELSELASASGFEILDDFESDGQNGRLGLYQVWQAI